MIGRTGDEYRNGVNTARVSVEVHGFGVFVFIGVFVNQHTATVTLNLSASGCPQVCSEKKPQKNPKTLKRELDDFCHQL